MLQRVRIYIFAAFLLLALGAWAWHARNAREAERQTFIAECQHFNKSWLVERRLPKPIVGTGSHAELLRTDLNLFESAGLWPDDDFVTGTSRLGNLSKSGSRGLFARFATENSVPPPPEQHFELASALFEAVASSIPATFDVHVIASDSKLVDATLNEQSVKVLLSRVAKGFVSPSRHLAIIVDVDILDLGSRTSPNARVSYHISFPDELEVQQLIRDSTKRESPSILANDHSTIRHHAPLQ